MNCEALQTAIPDLLYGSLPDEEAQLVNAHLAHCAGCNRLVADLKPIRGSLSKPPPPPALAAELKLAARDELLRQQLASRRGPLHLAGTIVLAVCLAVVGFALGARWKGDQNTRDGMPNGEDYVVTTPGDDDGDGVPNGGGSDPREVEGAEPLQRMLVEAARGYLERHELERARDYFARARELAPRGPVAAQAGAGEAEALIGLERKAEARTLLRATRALVLAGEIEAEADVLQRLYDLEAKLEGE